MASRKCPICNRRFEVTSSNPKQKYCSRECRDESMRKRVIVHCDYCGKPKEITIGESLSYEHHYCDRQCKGRARVGVSPANKSDNSATCPVCGKVFHSPPSANQQYCSLECARGVQVQALRRSNTKRTKPRVQRTCQQCGKVFDIPEWAMNRPTYDMGKFCSRECQIERKRQVRGDAHPLKVPYVQLTCQWCGKTYEKKPSEAQASRFCCRACHGAWSARNMSRKETSIEAAIRVLLDDLDVAYSQEHQIDFYTCDFLIASSRLVIECDGSYWHSLDKVFRRDKKKDKYLAAKGYVVLRLPEQRIKSDIAWCRQQILSHL